MIFVVNNEVINRLPEGLCTKTTMEEAKSILDTGFFYPDSHKFQEGEKQLKVMFSIRTTHTNKVLLVEHLPHKSKTGVLFDDLKYPVTMIDLSKGEIYRYIPLNIANLIRDTFDNPYSAMANSMLQLIGYYNTDDSFYLYYNIILKDTETKGFVCVDEHKTAKFEDIESVATFTNIDFWTTIVLPTLKLVKNE